MLRNKGDIWKHFTESKVQVGEGAEKKEVTQNVIFVGKVI